MTSGRTSVVFELNGRRVATEVFPHELLSDVLRSNLGHTDVKVGCGEGVCGTCTVLLDDEPVSACLVFGCQVDGRRVVTVRGLSMAEGELHALQESFLDYGAAQCGFCTPGMIVTAYWYLQRNPTPSRAEIRAALSGNLCRCTGYSAIIDAVDAYARAAVREVT